MIQENETWQSVTLCGGPLDGNTFRVQAGPRELHLNTRPRRGARDVPPVAVYGRDGDEGDLQHLRTNGGS